MINYEKAYKDALERAREFQKSKDGLCVLTAESIFPELQESDDEKIRKSLINVFSNRKKYLIDQSFGDSKVKDIIAWLEKQGEKKPIMNVPTREVILSIWDLGNEWKELTNGSISTKYGTQLDYIQKHWHESEYYLREKQGEQKPTDKVEPKFHEGDWIIDKQGIVHQIEKVIENVTNNTFGYDLVGGGYFNEEVKSYRLWTIADAKDGNVLYSLDSNRPFIYKERNGYEQATAYCGLNIYGKFFVWNTKDCIITTDKYIPATKEQHDTLLKAMADAGYTFDFEKKELKLLISNGGDFESNNSKQNPTWSEEDEEMIDKIIDYMKPMPIFFESTKGKSGKEYTKEFIKNAIKWLKSIKGRIQPQQKWTEEYENGFGETLWAINKARTIAENENDMGNLWYAENWLTSLKERLI